MISKIFVCFVSVVFIFGSCENKKEDISPINHEQFFRTGDDVILEFTVFVDRKVYEYTNYGEPPQVAFWVEQPDSGKIRTVWVSHRTGRQQWKGKVECPVSLPYWESRHKLEESSFRERSLFARLFDAVTGATPKGGEFTVKASVPADSQWEYFIEVNLSGDFNVSFPSQLENGTPDPEGNGQPSLIYKGEIEAKPGPSNVPQLIGRTDQWVAIDSIITDLTGITSAKNILSSLEVKCVVREID